MEDNNKVIKELLKEYMETASNLEKDVVEIILNQDDILSFMNDVQAYGCISGVVAELITYKQTGEFFTKHMDEIFDMLNDFISEVGSINIEINSNNLAWFSFEQVINNLSSYVSV